MKLKLHKVHDGITPSLARLAVKARNTRLAMRQGGMAAVSLTKRSFGDASLRVATWPPLKASTLAARRRKRYASAPLRASGHLWQSIRVIDATDRSVTIGSDRREGSYSVAAIHQLGAPRAGIPARPFFPFKSDGRATALARERIEMAIRRALRF